MKKIKKFKLTMLLMGVLVAGMFFSCNQKPIDDNDEKHNYALVSMVGQSYNLVTFQDFTEGSNISFDNAITFPYGHFYFDRYGDHIYAMSIAFGMGGEQKLHKYEIDENGRLKEVGTLSFKGTPNVSGVVFANEEKAYGVTNGSRGQLVIFNPKTMTEIGEIDLSEYGIGDNDPDAGVGIVRDGKLFLCLNQTKSMMELVDCPAQVAVIDVATDKVDKIIEDDRAISIGMIGHTNAILDENGDIYFYTGPRAAMMALYIPGFGIKDGFLRIKKGETDFDKDYYFSLQDPSVDGETGSYAMFLTYVGNGKAYCFLEKPSLITDPSLSMEDPQYFEVNKDYVPYEVNIWNKTGKIIPMPASSGWAASASIQVGDNVYFGEHTKEGVGFYKYNFKTGEASEKPSVTMPSAPYLVKSLY